MILACWLPKFNWTHHLLQVASSGLLIGYFDYLALLCKACKAIWAWWSPILFQNNEVSASNFNSLRNKKIFYFRSASEASIAMTYQLNHRNVTPRKVINLFIRRTAICKLHGQKSIWKVAEIPTRNSVALSLLPCNCNLQVIDDKDSFKRSV